VIDINGKVTFPGGVHPDEHKELTENCEIQAGPTPLQVQILLSQHIGAPCKALVGKRDKVEAGQKVGGADAFVSAGVHSPFAGTVKDVGLASHPVLGRTGAVIIDVDQEAGSISLPDNNGYGADLSLDSYSAEQIREAVNEAGIVGMGGAGFPTRVKIEPNPQMPLNTLVINACECEPYITCDYRVMLEWTEKFLAGVRLLQKASGCENVYIGIEDNKPEAISKVREALKGMPGCEGYKVVEAKTKYPQGGERQLIRAVLGREVPAGGIPPMIGVLVCNVATACAAAEAVVKGIPVTGRVVTVSGGGINKPGNYYCAVGTAVQDLLDFCGGVNDKAVKVLMGGPMMGFAIADMSTPLTKTSGAVTVLTENEIGSAKFANTQTPCIRCGRCLSVCPVNINPTKIAHAVKHDMLDVANDYNMGFCMECGSCSYVCPANIEITGYIKTGKILEARRKKLMPE